MKWWGDAVYLTGKQHNGICNIKRLMYAAEKNGQKQALNLTQT